MSCVDHIQCPRCSKHGNDRSHNNLAVYADGSSIALAVIIMFLLVALRRSKDQVKELEVTLDFHQMWMNSYLKKLGISSDNMH